MAASASNLTEETNGSAMRPGLGRIRNSCMARVILHLGPPEIFNSSMLMSLNSSGEKKPLPTESVLQSGLFQTATSGPLRGGGGGPNIRGPSPFDCPDVTVWNSPDCNTLFFASAFFFTEIKTGAFRKTQELWFKWELPGMVILSLLLQFVLVWFGNRRKYQGRGSPYIAILVWSTYLAADWVATVVLSTLLKSERKELNSELVVFWTPFLLLHLGGPHTISAYSLSDNELWLRHLLGLVIQVGVAVYVYTRFQTNSTLTYMAIPIFIAGIIKYGERIWILRAASNKQFSKSVFSSQATEKSLPDFPTDGPNMETFRGSPTEGSNMETLDLEGYLKKKNVIEEGKYIHRAFFLFKIFIPLFSDLKLRILKKLSKIVMIPSLNAEDVFVLPSLSAEDAFKMVHIELGFLYDVLFTKTATLQSVVGVILRSFCFLTTFAALFAFSIVVGKSGYPRVDVTITYLLLGGAIFLDIYSAISHAFSHWTTFWLTNPSNSVDKLVGRKIVSWLVCRQARKKKIISMAQHSLIDYCLKATESCRTRILRILDNEDILEKFWWTSWKDVNLDLKNFIYLHLQEKFKRYQNIGSKTGNVITKIDPQYEVFDYKLLLVILKERGDHALQIYGMHYQEDLKWSTIDIEFSHGILVWHIATYLLFHDDCKRYSGSVLGSNCQFSKLLSDYMMYLLLVQPQMLPKGIGEVRIQDTRKQMIGFFNREKSLTHNEAIYALLGINPDIGIQEFARSKSVMFEGCKLALMLRALEGESRRDQEEKWKMIAEVWMEMLAFAANRCEWKEHAARLSHGSELLTHVALLMAHFGLTEHIQIVERGRFISDPFFHWDWDRLSELADCLA